MSELFEGKRIVVTGGTGSLGQVLTRRLMSGVEGVPESVTVFSRDEAKQHWLCPESSVSSPPCWLQSS